MSSFTNTKWSNPCSNECTTSINEPFKTKKTVRHPYPNVYVKYESGKQGEREKEN